MLKTEPRSIQPRPWDLDEEGALTLSLDAEHLPQLVDDLD